MAEVGIGGVRAENAGGKVPPETLYIQLHTHMQTHTPHPSSSAWAGSESTKAHACTAWQKSMAVR